MSPLGISVTYQALPSSCWWNVFNQISVQTIGEVPDNKVDLVKMSLLKVWESIGLPDGYP